MSIRPNPEAKRRIERHVDEILTGSGLSPVDADEARGDFIEHLVAETTAQIAAGFGEEEAVERALARFGESGKIRQHIRDWAAGTGSPVASRNPLSGGADGRLGMFRATATWLAGAVYDIRFAGRGFLRAPGFSATVVLTIAIGIAATTTIFSIVDGVLLRPLPYPEPDRIVAIWPSFWFSNSSFELLQQHLDLEAGAFTLIAGSSPRNARYRDADGARTVLSRRVTARFLDVLGPVMELGGTFAPDANEPGNELVVVLTHGFWRRELGADPEVVGSSITLEGRPHTVVGVLADGYDLLLTDVELVLPKVFDRESVRYRSDEMKGVGRLRQGATHEQARSELEAIVAGWRTEYGLSEDFGADFEVLPFRDYLIGEVRPTLVLLFGSVVLILLIASVNVVNLLLVRGADRQREVSLRLALGAGPWRVVRLLLTEATLLSLCGGAVGLVSSFYAVRAVVALLPADTPRLAAVTVDGRVALFAAGLALGVGWLVAVVPAVRLVSVKLRDSMAAGGRGATHRQWLRRTMAAVEIGVSVMLLVGAGLLVKSFWQLNRVDPGLHGDGLVTFYVGAERGRIDAHEEAEAFHALVRQRLAALPGVAGVSTISQAPYNLDGGVVGCRAFDEAVPDADNEDRCRWRAVGADYFEIAGTRLVAGRVFGPEDTEGAEPVAIVSRAAATALFGDSDALGQRVATGFESTVPDGLPWATVVGIVQDVRFLGLAEQAPLLVYRPDAQVGAINERFGAFGSEYVVRAPPGGASFEAVVAEVRTVDPYAVVSGYAPMRQLIARSVADRRAVLILMSAFTLAAVVLATIGIYGVTAHGVHSRNRELGVKMALGASHRDVLREVLVGGLKITLAGVLAGLVLSIGLGRLVERFLYEVSASDPWIVGAAMLLALVVSTAATWVPARRAAMADPIEALTDE